MTGFSVTAPFAPLTALLPPLAGGRYLSGTVDPVLALLLAAVVVLYLWGVARNNRLHPRHRWPAGRTACFVGFVVVTAAALFSFIGVYDATLFWDHMIQHLMLIMVAAGLLAGSAPIALAWRATTGDAHRRLSDALRSRPAVIAGHPATAFILYGVLVPLTHLTVFFNWAIEWRAVDDLEHVLFLAIGYMFWRHIFGADPNRYRTHPAVRALLLFLAVPVDTFVGLSLDSESHEIFPAFVAMHRTWGMSLVMTLHVGGVIMWVGGDTLMTAALIPVVWEWVRLEERKATRFDRELDAFFPPSLPGPGQPTAGAALGTYASRSRTRHPGAAGTGPGQGPAPAPAAGDVRPGGT
jgi:cytochrome c oxidase assembly factor CtaG